MLRSPSTSGRQQLGAAPTTAPLSRWEVLAVVGLLSSALVVRTTALDRPVWLDEAWVGNAIMAPTMSDMVYYERWDQTTPPLYLTMARAVVAVLGVSEFSLRSVAVVAGVLSVFALYLALRSVVGFPLAYSGAALLAANYYAIKYGQQIKQYSTDVLTSCLAIGLLWGFLNTRGSRRWYLALLGFSVVAPLLSYPSVFWFPALLLAVAVMAPRASADSSRTTPWLKFSRLFCMAAIMSAAFLTTHLLFIAPNRSAQIFKSLDAQFIGSGGLLVSLVRFGDNVSSLLLPHLGWTTVVSYALSAIVLLGLLRIAVEVVARSPRALHGLTLVVPIASAVVASGLRKYPVLEYERLIIFMLPAAIGLVVWAADVPWRVVSQRLSRTSLIASHCAVAGACLCLLVAALLFLRKNPGTGEDARGALLQVKRAQGPGEALFIPGAFAEQLYFYSQLWGWSPDHTYIGNIRWPCCPRNLQKTVSSPQTRSWSEDLTAFERTADGRVWMMLPSGRRSHWSYRRRKEFGAIIPWMTTAGYKVEAVDHYEHVSLYRLVRSVEMRSSRVSDDEGAPTPAAQLRALHSTEVSAVKSDSR